MKLLQNKLSLLVIAFALIATSCVSKKDFEALQENKDLLQSSLNKANEKLTACEDEKTALMGKVSELESTVASQSSALSSKDAQISSLQGDIAAEKQKREAIFTSLSDVDVMTETEVATFKEAMDKVSSMPDAERNAALTKALTENLTKYLNEVEAKGVEVTTKGGSVLLSLSDKILYNSGRSTLTEEAKAILNAVGKVIQANGNIDVLVEGHTDTDPIQFTSSRSNWDLSIKRAMRVANYLEKEVEVAPSRLVVAGRGEHAPKADNATEEGKATNRRTEIMLVPGLDDYFRMVTGN